MKVRTSIAAAGTAVLIGAGALVLPAVASARTASHTLALTSVTKSSIMFTKTTGAQQNTDENRAGKIVGYDMLYFTVGSKSTAAVNVTVDVNGGFLYGTMTLNIKTMAVTNGKVRGGTGKFKGATGTITARNLNKAGTRTAVTITYQT